MEGWNLSNGELNDNKSIDLFSPICFSLISGKHTTTYKFCFLKSLLDNLYKTNVNELSFRILSETFSKIYWNLISVYKMPQMVDYETGARCSMEKIVEKILEKYPFCTGVYFDSLRLDVQREFLENGHQQFIRYVIGAFYQDTNGYIFGFSKKKGLIWFNDISLSFLRKNQKILEQLNYYQWLKKIENILKANSKSIDNLSTVLECVTERKNLTKFKNELLLLGEEKKCFYCGKALKTIHLDHFIPWDFIKSDDLWNFVFSCPSCNSSKNNCIPINDYIDKLAERNKIFNIESPDLKTVVYNASCNGVRIDWRPKNNAKIS